jgi:hypothetical protein
VYPRTLDLVGVSVASLKEVSMARWACIGASTIATVAMATFGATAEAHAAATAGICKSLSVSGVKLQWSTIGNVSCKVAKPWLLKILAKHTRPGAKVTPKNGPRGFHCSASNDSKGIPSAGACYTGTLAFPKNGFQWFG